jgi:hypothetical protein
MQNLRRKHPLLLLQLDRYMCETLITINAFLCKLGVRIVKGIIEEQAYSKCSQESKKKKLWVWSESSTFLFRFVSIENLYILDVGQHRLLQRVHL